MGPEKYDGFSGYFDFAISQNFAKYQGLNFAFREIPKTRKNGHCSHVYLLPKENKQDQSTMSLLDNEHG